MIKTFLFFKNDENYWQPRQCRQIDILRTNEHRLSEGNKMFFSDLPRKGGCFATNNAFWGYNKNVFCCFGMSFAGTIFQATFC
jgi:hypothetical protein